MAVLDPLLMHQLLDQDLQTMGFFSQQDLSPEEIDLQINTQIDIFVEAVLDKELHKRPRVGVKEGFQENQVRLDDLRTIHVKDASTTLVVYDTNNYKFDLPSDYSHYIKTKLKCTTTCLDEKKKATIVTNLGVLRIEQTQDIDTMRIHPFYQSKKESPLGEIVNNTVYIYSEGLFNITEAKLDYIKKPAVVKYAVDVSGNYDSGNSVTCDLPHTVHRMIIKMTSLHLSTILESNPQKIENLKQEFN